MGDVAAIYIQRGPSAGQQTTACWAYAQAEHVPMRMIVPYFAMEQAVSMIRDRIVNVIIVAFDSRAVRQLASEIEPLGGQVVFVHPSPTTLHPPHTSSLPHMWWDAGRTEHEIAMDLDAQTKALGVVVYIHPDEHQVRQLRAIIDYCDSRDRQIVGRVTSPQSAVQAVVAGIAKTVVAASVPHNGLRNLVGAAGGQVIFVRERSHAPTLREFLGRAIGLGRTPAEIAHLTGDSTGEVASLIETLGLRTRPE